MDYIQVDGLNYTPIANYNGYLKANTNFGIDETSSFAQVLKQKQVAMETPAKLEGGIQMVDFDKVISDTLLQEEKKQGQSGSLLTQISGSVNKNLNDVNSKMKSAEAAQEAFAMGEDVSVHDVMIAAEKSKLSFQMAMQVRNKMLSAYSELNNIRV